MAKIQCKMCGGQVELPDGVTSGECPYCGSLTTFPKIADTQTEHLYARAEHFRQKSDFDKAVAAFESILDVNSEDPEAWWGLLISKYGIEYVEDPATHERIPTCHRVQFESILADSDYLNVLKYASGADRDIYEKEANRISEIQKAILKISAQEKPYDVFICYKETTDGGTRTKDSTLAQEIYYQLANQGLNVFFSRITLEDKIGQQYEPYIFAALNSAKVMLVIGSKREYFESVWVKNEWSRYLALKKKDRSRLIIPCYKDMDPYDLPEELSLFQSQDMGKIGFIQDLLRGIMKVVNASAQAAAPASGGNAENAKIQKLISILLEQQEWDEAKAYCRKLLESDPENPEPYLFRCLISHQIQNETGLIKIAQLLDSDRNFQTAMKFASPERKSQLERILKPDRLAIEHENETIDLPGGLKMEMARVAAGAFEMGARDGENSSSEAAHQTTLTRDFFIGRTEVTQAQWKSVMGSDPSYSKGDDLPVERVTWNDAMEFCEKLNSMGKAPAGWKFTLPTETQWEYAARGGNKSKGYKYSGSDDIDEVAWYVSNSGYKTHPVGQKKNNELGLYDMSGNVWEWCLDDWNSNSCKLKAEFARGNDRGGLYRTIRGGSWIFDAKCCRTANRGINSPSGRLSSLGFRVALVPESY